MFLNYKNHTSLMGNKFSPFFPPVSLLHLDQNNFLDVPECLVLKCRPNKYAKRTFFWFIEHWGGKLWTAYAGEQEITTHISPCRFISRRFDKRRTYLQKFALRVAWPLWQPKEMNTAGSTVPIPVGKSATSVYFL
jgi:hypothetical protein